MNICPKKTIQGIHWSGTENKMSFPTVESTKLTGPTNKQGSQLVLENHHTLTPVILAQHMNCDILTGRTAWGDWQPRTIYGYVCTASMLTDTTVGFLRSLLCLMPPL